MTYTSLIGDGFFTGIHGDVTTAAVGILGIMVIIVGVGMLIRVFSR